MLTGSAEGSSQKHYQVSTVLRTFSITNNDAHDSVLKQFTSSHKIRQPLHLSLLLPAQQLMPQPPQRLLQLQPECVFEILTPTGCTNEITTRLEDTLVSEGKPWNRLFGGKNADDAALDIVEAALV